MRALPWQSMAGFKYHRYFVVAPSGREERGKGGFYPQFPRLTPLAARARTAACVPRSRIAKLPIRPDGRQGRQGQGSTLALDHGGPGGPGQIIIFDRANSKISGVPHECMHADSAPKDHASPVRSATIAPSNKVRSTLKTT